MVTDGAAASHSFVGLVDDLLTALDEDSALVSRLEDMRAHKLKLDEELRTAREEASRSAARREIEQLVAAADERVRTAEYDAAEQAARSGAERRALTARLRRIEASCDELLAAVARLAEAAREPAIIIDDRTHETQQRRRRRWMTRARRTRVRRYRLDEALADRISRVMAPPTGATASSNAEAVEARIRNMSHGTNGE